MIFIMAGNLAFASSEQNVKLCDTAMELMEQAAQQPMQTITSPVINETLVGPLQLKRVAIAVGMNIRHRSLNLVHWEYMHRIYTYQSHIDVAAKKINMTAYTYQAYRIASLGLVLQGRDVPHFTVM